MNRFLAVALLSGGLALAQRPPTERAWDLLASGQRAEAVAVLQQILKDNANDAEAHLMLGSILSEDGRHNEAVAQLQDAVRLLPRSAQAHHALGDALNASRLTKAAGAEFQKTIELDPNFAPARLSLAVILLQSENFNEAERHLDLALKIYGDSPDAAYSRYLKAKVLTQRNEIEQATAELTKAVNLQPDFAEAWSDLGEAREALQDENGAFTAYQRAVQADPDNSIAQYHLGAEYLQKGDASQAVKHLEAAYRLNPKNQSTLYSLQQALRRNGHTARADEIKAKLSELIRERNRESQRAMAALKINNEGAELEKQGKLEEAREKYGEATQLDPEHVGIRTNFAAALLKTGQWSEGLRQLKEALRRDPENQDLQKALKDAQSAASRN